MKVRFVIVMGAVGSGNSLQITDDAKGETKEELEALREECSVLSGEFLRLAHLINHSLLTHFIPRIWKKRYNIALSAFRPHISPHNIPFGVL